MTSRRRLLAGLLALPAAAGVTALTARSAEALPPVLVTLGCAVRLDSLSAGPTVLANEGHVPLGMVRAEVVGGDVHVHFERPLQSIVTSWVQPDEQMVTRAITIGPSVGLDRVVLRFAVAGKYVTGLDTRLYGRNVNFFVGVIGYASPVA